MTHKYFDEIHLLIVDDEVQILKSLKGLFRKDYKISLANSGEKALELVKKSPEEFHLVITDQKMPGMQGFELLKGIKEVAPHVVSMLVTGYSDFDSLIKSINEGHIYSYVSKPWDPRELKLLVKRAEEHFRLVTSNEIMNKELLKYQEHLSELVEERTAELKKANHDLMLEISERKEAESKSRFLAEEADRANKAKTIFLANISHEIRTPMNGIIGMNSLLLTSDLNPQQKQFSEIIQSNSENLLAIIEDLLDIAKIESEKISIEKSSFDLRLCIEETLDLLSVSSAEKGIELLNHIDSNIPFIIEGDAVRLRQVLYNLVGNAIKFTEKGEVLLSVKRHTGLEASNDFKHKILYILFEIKDTGIGIPEDKKNLLFKSFYQIDSSSTRKYGGTGLGLAISSRLIKLMGGIITVESELDTGSTFSFTIPTREAEGETTSFIDTNSVDFKDKKVLIVDDNLVALKLLEKKLKVWGMSPKSFISSREALAFLDQEEHFDVAIIDMIMPEIDGVMLAEKFKENEKYNSMPIIMLSAFGTEDIDSKNFTAVITKPAKDKELFNAIASALISDYSEDKRVKLIEKPKIDPEMAIKHPLNILLADNNLVNQKLISFILKKMGYEIDTANNSVEVIEAANNKKYDIIFIDLSTSQMNGIETISKISLNSSEKSPKIIGMIADAISENLEDYIRQGVDDFMLKPVRAEELIRILKKAS